MSRNRIVLNICGTDCAIFSDDDEGYIRSVGVEVDKAITGILHHNDRISVTMAAMLTALNYCDMNHKATEGADSLRTQIKDYLEDSSRARLEAEESKREVERLKREIQTLRTRLEEQSKEAVKPAEAAAPQETQEEAPQPASEEQEFMSFFEKKDDEQ